MMAAEGPILLQKDNTFTKLFVGGLPYHTTDETLYDFFVQFGDIEEAVVIHDRITTKSKGYGFVTMKDKEGAERACVNPNPIIDGRKANVNLAYLGAKNKHSQQTSPYPGLGRSDSPNSSLYSIQTQSPSHGIQVPPTFFLPSPPGPPHHPHFFPPDGAQPFSPPPHFINPMFIPQFFNGGSPPPFAYLPPPGGPQHQMMSFVPFNVAN